jgi:hypothetical protein
LKNKNYRWGILWFFPDVKFKLRASEDLLVFATAILAQNIAGESVFAALSGTGDEHLK